MAQVRLGRYQAENGGLPTVCMRCGAPASLEKPKRFSWHPQWVIILLILTSPIVYIIVALILTKRMRVRAPLCQDHSNHWLWRSWFIWGGFVACLLIAIGLLVTFSQLNERTRDSVMGFTCVGTFGLWLVWLIAAAIIQNLAIRPTEITDRSITLTHVAPEFVKAVLRARERGENEEDELYEPRPRRSGGRDSDQFYDRGPRRRKSTQTDPEDEDKD